MSQHPAPNVPIAPPGIHTTDPTPADDMVAKLRAALDLVEWDENDRLAVGANGINVECRCCGTVIAITGQVVQHSRQIADLIVQATNNLPALLAEIEALSNDLAAKRSDFDAALAALGEADTRAAVLVDAANRDGDRAGKLADIRALATEWAALQTGAAARRLDGRAILAILDRDETGSN